MSDYIIPVVCAVIALGGGIYATRGKRATDRGDLADRLWDQLQEGDLTLQAERRRASAREQVWADYAVRLRRQIEASGQDPPPYPDALTK